MGCSGIHSKYWLATQTNPLFLSVQTPWKLCYVRRGRDRQEKSRPRKAPSVAAKVAEVEEITMIWTTLKERKSLCLSVCESESVCVCVCVSPSLCVCVSVYLSVLTPRPNPRKLEGPCPPRRPTTLFPYLPSHMLHPSSVCSHPVCLSVCPYTTSMTGIVLLASLFWSSLSPVFDW